MAEGRDVDEVGVVGMDDDVADVARRGEALVLPRPPAIGGFVDAVAVGKVAADRRLAHTGIDHIRVCIRDDQCADGSGLERAVRDILPMRAAIGRFPDTARAATEEERPLLSRMPGDGDDAPAPMGPDAPPFE